MALSWFSARPVQRPLQPRAANLSGRLAAAVAPAAATPCCDGDGGSAPGSAARAASRTSKFFVAPSPPPAPSSAPQLLEPAPHAAEDDAIDTVDAALPDEAVYAVDARVAPALGAFRTAQHAGIACKRVPAHADSLMRFARLRPYAGADVRHCAPLAAAATAALDARFEAFRRASSASAGGSGGGGGGGVGGAAAKLRSPIVPRAAGGGKRARATVAVAAGGVAGPSFEAFMFTPRAK
jgi:hypothetical protein